MGRLTCQLQSFNTVAAGLLRATDCRMIELQNAFRQRRTQVSFIEGTLVNLQRENDASSDLLKTLQENIQNFCGFVESRSEQSSYSSCSFLPDDDGKQRVSNEPHKPVSIRTESEATIIPIEECATEISPKVSMNTCIYADLFYWNFV